MKSEHELSYLNRPLITIENQFRSKKFLYKKKNTSPKMTGSQDHPLCKLYKKKMEVSIFKQAAYNKKKSNTAGQKKLL